MADAEYKRLAPHPRACETCEQQFTPKINRGRFCGKSCSDKARKPKEIQCVGCGQTVNRNVRGGSADAGLYCSRGCYFALKGRLKQEKDESRNAMRLGGLSYTAHVRRWRMWLREQHLEEVREGMASTGCRTCGASVGYLFGRPRTYCGKACRPTPPVNREVRKAHKRARRARTRGIEAENIKPADIFDRDGWRCQMCGVHTPKKLRGTCNPKAPEMDHMIPLAKGGKHVASNLQCLCRACNAWKSDKLIPTQHRLFEASHPR